MPLYSKLHSCIQHPRVKSIIILSHVIVVGTKRHYYRIEGALPYRYSINVSEVEMRNLHKAGKEIGTTQWIILLRSHKGLNIAMATVDVPNQYFRSTTYAIASRHPLKAVNCELLEFRWECEAASALVGGPGREVDLIDMKPLKKRKGWNFFKRPNT